MEIKQELKKTNINKALLETGIIFLASRCFFALIIYLAPNTYGDIINLFDGQHYQDIANYGYYGPIVTAFFPVVPMVIRCLGVVGALIINQLAFLATLVLLGKLGMDRFTLLIFAFSPVAFFSMVAYTESLFMMLCVLAFYLYTRKHFGPVYGPLLGVVMGLAVCTRNSGALLFFATFVGMCIDWVRKQVKFTDIVYTYVPATLISLIYPVYLQVKFGNWKLFVDIQNTGWSHVSSNIFKTLKIQLEIIFKNNYYQADAQTRILTVINEVVSIAILAWIVVLVVIEIRDLWRKGIKNILSERVVLLLFTIFSVIAFNSAIRDPYADMPTISYFRYYLALFPIYIYVNKHNENKKFILFAVFIAFSFLTSYFFCKGTFFY